MKLKHLDLFSGIGGFSLGLEATGGFETVAFCDIEEFPRKVLQKHWPYVKQYKDIKELNYEKLKADGIGPIDILTCGYPCQPFSVAGRKKGEKDPRHLWPDCFRLIKECRPSFVIGENVAGHIKLGLDTVLQDLESEMYSARCFSISASSVGANHQRERVWIVAYYERNYHFNEEQRVNGEEEKISREHRKKDGDTRKFSGTDSIRETDNEYVENTRRTLRQGSELRKENEDEVGKGNANQFERSSGSSEIDVADAIKGNVETGRERQREIREGHQEEGIPSNASSCGENVADTQGIHAQGQHDGQRQKQPWGEGWWAVEPELGRVAHGIPDRVHRLKSLGNSLIPAIPYYLGLAILESMKDA